MSPAQDRERSPERPGHQSRQLQPPRGTLNGDMAVPTPLPTSKRVPLWLGGALVGYLLSPISPLIRWLLQSTQSIPYSPDLQSINLPVVILLAFITLVVPFTVYAWMRKRWSSFSWGLLIVILTISVPAFVLALLVPFYVNY